MVNGSSTLGNCLAVSTNVKHMPTLSLRSSTLRCCIQQNECKCSSKYIFRNVCSNLFMYVNQNEKKFKCPSSGERINKSWDIHTLQQNMNGKVELLLHTKIWLTITDTLIILSKRRQALREFLCMSSCIWNSNKKN